MRVALGTGAFRPYGLTVPAVAGVGLFMGLLAWSMDNTSYDTWGGVLVGMAVTTACLPLVIHLAKKETDARVARLLPWAFVLKMGAALVRLAIAFGVYDGVADANTYHVAGESLGPMYRRGDFSGELGTFIGGGFIKGLTGVVYAVTGATKLGGFIVFSAIGFWGLYFFYRAFCLACPEGDRWRYALLVFLLPSMLFWPSSIGKEAWMTLSLGVAAYGAARILTKRRAGFALLGLGLLGAVAVRPHVAAILMFSLVAAYLLRRPPLGASLLTPVAKIVGVVILAIGLAVVVGKTKELFGVRDQFNAEAVSEILERARNQTSNARSVFGSSESTNLSPTRFPSALMSVLFRPFPWETRSLLALGASLEGMAILAVFVVGWRRVTGAVRSVLRTPYVVLCLCYSVLFVYGFSSFANFGILTRQRVQVFPFVLVLLALPPFHRQEQGWRGLLVEEPTHSARDEDVEAYYTTTGVH